MDATGQDAINGTQGTLRSLDVPADAVADARDFTEDLAEEITSELDPALQASRPATAATQPAPAAQPGRPATTNGASAGATQLLRDRYLLESQIGNGGTASVYRAVDLRRDAGAADDGRRVAVKLLRPELRDRPQSVARMQREFRQTQAVAHPNVVRFHDLDCDGDAWFIVMELLSGETLGPLLRRVAPAGMPPGDALRIACAVGDALAHAHARGVTHGDVKPDNIFLTYAGDVRLFDFGVAPESSAHSPVDGAGAPVAAAATRVYASPEVLSGEAPGPRDDVFSLGCVIHEMVAGRHPYGRRSADRVSDAAVVPVRLESIGNAGAAAVSSALSLARAGRPTMAELVRALRADETPQPSPVVAAAAAEGVAAAPPAEAPTPAAAKSAAAPGPKRRRPALVIGLAAGLALVVGILIGRLDPRPEHVPVAIPAQAPIAEPQSPPSSQALAPAAEPHAADALPEEPREDAARGEPPPASGPPGLVFFDGPKMVVSNRAVVAAIPLRHLNRTRRAVRVDWRIVDGTARAGLDYGGPMSGAETFVEGNSFRILYVPLVPNAAETRDRSFTVELTRVSEGASLGPTPRIEITILGSS